MLDTPKDSSNKFIIKVIFGAPSLQEGRRIEQLMEPLDDSYGFQTASEDDNFIPPLHDGLNWSNTNINAPYCLCSVCELAVVTDSEICPTCTYVQAFIMIVLIHKTFKYSVFYQMEYHSQLYFCSQLSVKIN